MPNMISIEPAQLTAVAALALTNGYGAVIYLEGRGDVLCWAQGDDHGYLAPDGSPLERVELGLRENGVQAPADPEPGVFYDGEEYEPLSAEEVAELREQHREADPRKDYHSEFARPDDPRWAPWIERSAELAHWAAYGAPSRTMVIQFIPADVEAPAPRNSVGANLADVEPYAAEMNADGELFCTGCGSGESLEYRENVITWRKLASNRDGELVFYGSCEEGDGDDDPGVCCDACDRPLTLPEGVTVSWT